MDTAEILVVIGGVGLIGLMLRYFFVEREQISAEANKTDIREINYGREYTT